MTAEKLRKDILHINSIHISKLKKKITIPMLEEQVERYWTQQFHSKPSTKLLEQYESEALKFTTGL